MALIPEQLLWSHTAAVEPFAELTVAFAMLAAVTFVRSKTKLALVWMVVATVFAVQFRPESLLIVPLVLLLIALYAPGEFRSTSLWGAGLLGCALSVVYVGHLVAVRSEGWGAPSDRASLEFLSTNFPVNGWFYLWDERSPVVYGLLALLGLVIHRTKGSLVTAVYFVLFWGIFIPFYAGSYNYGADVRFSLMTFPALAILAASGAAGVSRLLSRRGLPSTRASRVVALALCIQFLWLYAARARRWRGGMGGSG